MSTISLLDQETIDKIAAGEVVERPSSVVKELVENAIDAGATAVTVEIKEGGISFIRITDNGCGIAKKEVALAFLRHSTSKIKSAADLAGVRSLGFRGEALSSIAAVARVELITKTCEELTGTRYVIEGSKELAAEDVGAPEGTTFLVRDLFYNTPARRKFLKTAQTEGTYISEMLEKLALSHPGISFKYINNNQTKLHTSGNGSCRDVIYHIYGREIASQLLPVSGVLTHGRLSGFIAKPAVSRGNRNFESYFINGRYIRSSLLSGAIEEAYRGVLMQRQFPFTVLYFDFEKETVDVNVHPSKMELRFDGGPTIYRELVGALQEALHQKELIPEVSVEREKPRAASPVVLTSVPEPFEKRRLETLQKKTSASSGELQKHAHVSYQRDDGEDMRAVKESADGYREKRTEQTQPKAAPKPERQPEAAAPQENGTQMTLEMSAPEFLTEAARKKHRIIGQLFETYWLIEYEDKLYIMDQHAAHEKVLFERKMAQLARKEYTSQVISPPIVLSLDAREQEMLSRYGEQIERLGYVLEPFGGKEYMISAVPDNLFSLDVKELFIEMLDGFTELTGRETPELIVEKVASMSCRAAVKGSSRLSLPEIDALVGELLTLDNPYHCPHGRPTVIAMTKQELEKKFKRIV